MVAYGLVLLPLPVLVDNFCEIYNSTSNPQLIPFNFVGDYFSIVAGGRAAGESYLRAMLANTALLQAVYNFLLLLPLGVFLKQYFKTSLTKIIAIAFGVSLSFELLQFSGLLGVYPCPYRLFDVDDLMLNTAGAVAGFFIPSIFIFKGIENKDKRTIPTNFLKRFVAFIIDITIVLVMGDVLAWLVGDVTVVASSVLTILVMIIYYVVLPKFTNNQTLGLKAVKLKIAPSNASFMKLFIRSLPIISVPVVTAMVYATLPRDYVGAVELLYIILLIATMSLSIIFAKDGRGIHEKLSKTKLISSK